MFVLNAFLFVVNWKLKKDYLIIFPDFADTRGMHRYGLQFLLATVGTIQLVL
jgi:hypothetical protein